MKLLPLFLSGALAGDRTFADKPDFMLATDDWWTQKIANNKVGKLADNSDIYFDLYVPQDNNDGQRAAGKMKQHLQNTRDGMVKIANRCNGRSRRSAGDDDTRYVVPANNAQQAMYQIFYQHAQWVRNEIFSVDKCQKHAVRIFKRLDRFQQIWAWHYCSKVDESPQFCDWALLQNDGSKKTTHPRKTKYLNDKYGRDVNTAYTAVGCEHARDGPQEAELVCPMGGYIKINVAKYGRFGKGICSKSGHAGIQKPCDKYTDVTSYAKNVCEGQTECSLKVGNSIVGFLVERQDPCHGVPKYTTVNWECTADKPANPDDGFDIACEHGSQGDPKLANLSCPSGKTILVTSAEYGRWSSNTCTGHNASNKICGKYVDVIDDATNKCNGKQSCDYRADNKVTGIVHERQDPCRGVPKYTRVKFECV